MSSLVAVKKMTKLATRAVIAGCVLATGSMAAQNTASVRAELERLYVKNSEAYMRGDIQGAMALRAPDFHTVGPDGTRRDRAGMELYIQGIMNGVRKWNEIKTTIDSLTVSSDTAFAQTSQYVDRMALRPDNQVHHVQTWVEQREIWVRSSGQWLMWRVDQVRNPRRLVAGRPG